MKKIQISILMFSLFTNVVLIYKSRLLIKNKIISLTTASTDTDLQWTKKSYKTPFSQDDNSPFAVYSILDTINFLKIDKPDIEYDKLPDSLFISPGKYSFYGENYELKKDGVYRFIYPGVNNEQRIVFSGNIDTLLSSIAWIVTHGNSDAKLNIEQLMKKATDSKLFITCGTVSKFAHEVLESFEIKSRIILGMTTDNWNNYDNGHTLIEVYREKYKKWVVYDLDNNCFLVKDEDPLSFIELSNLIDKNQDYQIVKLSVDTKLAVNSFHDKKGYEYDFYSESIIATESSLKKWYKRVLQEPLIKDKNLFYFNNSDSITTKRLLGYSNNYRNLSTCEYFLNHFYSENYNIEKLRLKQLGLKVTVSGAHTDFS